MQSHSFGQFFFLCLLVRAKSSLLTPTSVAFSRLAHSSSEQRFSKIRSTGRIHYTAPQSAKSSLPCFCFVLRRELWSFEEITLLTSSVTDNFSGQILSLVSIWDYPFFLNLATSQLVTSQKPQTNELLQRKATQTNKGDTKHNQTTTILFFTLLLTYGFLEAIQTQTQEENIGQLNDTSPRKNHTGYHQFTYHSWTYHQGIHTFLLIHFYISLMNYSNPPSHAKLNCFFFIFQH